jgi:hypothetical protein
MRLRRWQVTIAATLMALATAVYMARWLLFPSDSLHNEMLRYLVDDVAFLFIQVLLVSMLLDGLMQRRSRDQMLTKLNMIIGAFYTECGTDLLGRISRLDDRLADVRADLVPTLKWEERDYARARQAFRDHEPQIHLTVDDLVALRERLDREKTYLLGLIGNQALLEHETFTDLLWAVTHVAEELHARGDLTHLPATDSAHLAADLRRAYSLLGVEWLDYMRHLRKQYPFLFSLAVRTNPLDPDACVTVTD